MSNVVKVRCFHFWSDWTELKEVEINLDEYVFFEVDYRGEDSWHIKGHKCISNYKWVVDELSEHGVVSVLDLVDFIKAANSYDEVQKCKVSRFNNLHYNDNFYDDLSGLLCLLNE